MNRERPPPRTPSESVSSLFHDFCATGGSNWPQFKRSKSMPVSRMECQMECLSIGDVTVASWEGEDCLLARSFV